MGSEQNRFPQQERCKRWGSCWGGLSCFGAQKGGKRIVPASRIPEGNASAAQVNGSQDQATSFVPSLVAPPSSPASFSNSALQSTAQSPSCFLSLSANSPGGPSNAMYATGPYAHETQLVSPPVFSTFTTEPSTAPFTPPPELAHLTTPSSPDVPFAKFISSSNDLHATYSLYPGSLRSPISRTSGDCLSSSFPEQDFPPQWDPSVSPQNGGYSRSSSGLDTNFFCPDTFARYYLDHDPQVTGRLSVTKDLDVYGGSANRVQNKSCKQDEEIEAYRASFGFSADEIITTSHYMEVSDVMNESFSMRPFGSNKQPAEELPFSTQGLKVHSNMQAWCNLDEDHKSEKQVNEYEYEYEYDEEEMMRSSKYSMGLSTSDTEIDYTSLRKGR